MGREVEGRGWDQFGALVLYCVIVSCCTILVYGLGFRATDCADSELWCRRAWSDWATRRRDDFTAAFLSQKLRPDKQMARWVHWFNGVSLVVWVFYSRFFVHSISQYVYYLYICMYVYIYIHPYIWIHMLTRLEKIMPQHARICMYNIAQSEGHLLTGSGEFDLHAFKPVSASIYIWTEGQGNVFFEHFRLWMP